MLVSLNGTQQNNAGILELMKARHKAETSLLSCNVLHVSKLQNRPEKL